MRYLIGIVVVAILAFLASNLPRVQAATLTLTPPHVTMYVGDTKTVEISGGGADSIYYIGTNGRPDIAGVVLKGSTLSVSSYYPGEGNVSVCAYVETALSCAALNISVLKKAEAQTGNYSATIKFSKTNVTVNIGETVNLTVEGSRSGSYYVSASSDPEVVYAGISGNIITIKGTKIGGSNITVCQLAAACGNIYAFVPMNAANTAAIKAALPPVPLLSAFYAASNNVGGDFASKGATLTIKFNTSDDITSKTVKVGGQEVAFTGTGSGPYGGTYVVTGNEPLPLTVSIGFSTAKGMAGHSSFAIGDKTGVSAPSASPTPAVSNPSGFKKFTRNLGSGSSGTEVTYLQGVLKQLGVYDGPITGFFGSQTEAAVKKYQSKVGLEQVGAVGPATRGLLNKTL